MKQLIIILTVLGLYGTMTNIIYLSPLPSLISALIFPIIIIQRKVIPTVVFWLLIFFIISLLSVLIYFPQSFTYFSFYRYDGNFIISYLPLLVLPFFKLNFNLDRTFRYFLYASTVVNLCMYLITVINDAPVFFSLFRATNAAGGYFSIMASLAFVYFYHRKTYFNLIIFLLQVLFLYATLSRGSMLGLGFGILFFFFLKYNKAYLITISLASIIIFQVILMSYSYPIYVEHFRDKDKYEFFPAIQNYIHKNYGRVDGKTVNVFLRLYDTWPRGIETFLNSPLVGTGFGSINDVPFDFRTVVPFLVSINNNEGVQFSGSHAHHSYLHILGEQGILGLFIFLMFWISIYKFLIRNGHHPQIRNFLLISFFNLTVMSFTEHRITTPSNALPFILAFGLYYVYVNYQKKITEEAAYPEKNE